MVKCNMSRKEISDIKEALDMAMEETKLNSVIAAIHKANKAILKCRG